MASKIINNSTIEYKSEIANAPFYRIFNFYAHEMILIHGETSGYKSGVSSNMTVKNFSDVENWDIIKNAHQALVDGGKNPGPMPEKPDVSRKPAPLNFSQKR